MSFFETGEVRSLNVPQTQMRFNVQTKKHFPSLGMYGIRLFSVPNLDGSKFCIIEFLDDDSVYPKATRTVGLRNSVNYIIPITLEKLYSLELELGAHYKFVHVPKWGRMAFRLMKIDVENLNHTRFPFPVITVFNNISAKRMYDESKNLSLAS